MSEMEKWLISSLRTRGRCGFVTNIVIMGAFLYWREITKETFYGLIKIVVKLAKRSPDGILYDKKQQCMVA